MRLAHLEIYQCHRAFIENTGRGWRVAGLQCEFERARAGEWEFLASKKYNCIAREFLPTRRARLEAPADIYAFYLPSALAHSRKIHRDSFAFAR